ncbi:alpha/beta fold hydrolase [Glutamicibacter sp.]|uniref:alpha/beta hydrolase family protein n=1 Tax=Glutamicibacter sp. TaxID=1931995 RepID=UPI0028BE6515|nr:alpha/beta fold hydrolase [Glutamicibacter sp.]
MPRKIVDKLEPRKTVPATIVGVGLGVAAGSLVAASVSALAGYFARRVVTPEERRAQNAAVKQIVTDEQGQLWMHLGRDSETIEPGGCTFLAEFDACAVRLSPPREVDGKPKLVARRIEQVYRGSLDGVRRGYLSGAMYEHPSDLGFTAEDVVIDLEIGEGPAWLVRGTQHQDVWVIGVHGRGARRNESIRALPALAKVGVTTLLMSYRNDGTAPTGPDGRYGLGDTEWLDVQAAVKYAQDHGARQIMLLGWSMGGAISLQMADRSELGQDIDALMLVGPVINWVDVLSHQARANKIPRSVGHFGQWLLSNKAGRWITGQAAPVNLKRLNWVDRADELTHPILLMHSRDDQFVPNGPSLKLAALRPDLVNLKTFTKAGHTREPNVDPQLFESAVSEFVVARIAQRQVM